MSKILVLGDPHIGGSVNIGRQGVGSSLNSRIIDQIKLLDWVYDQATSLLITNIIITGDVFEDPKPHHFIVSLLIDWLKKCSQSNISVHIIAGNHDILRSGQFYMSPLDIISSIDLDLIYVYKSIDTIKFDGMDITLLPFRDRRSFNTNSNVEALQLLSQKIKYEQISCRVDCKKVLVGHLALEGSIPAANELDELTNELFCPLDMFNGYDYVIMGHIHKFQILSKIPHMSHIGSMDLSDFGESEHTKYIAIIDSEKEIEYIPVPSRPLKHITISVEETEKDVLGFVLKKISEFEIKNAIVKITLKMFGHHTSPDRSKLESYLYSLGVFHVSRISEERTFQIIKNKVALNQILKK